VGTCDVAIIGSGLIGASIAFELARANCRVLLFDRQQPAREASWAAAGMLSASPDAADALPLVPLAKESLRLYAEFVAAVERASGTSVQYAHEGTLQILHGSHSEAERDALLAQHRSFGIAAEPVAIDAARRMEPALGPSARAALWLPDEATVDPRLLSEAVLAAAKRSGAELRAGCGVTAIECEPRAGAAHGEAGICNGVVAGGELITAKHVVVAAGAFSRVLAQSSGGASGDADDWLARCAPTHPVRGQMIALRTRSVSLQRVLRSDHGYLVPRRDGRIIAGSTLEDAGFEKRVTPAGVQQILSAALELAPALAGAEIVETWCGLRPGSPDNLPILGACGMEGVLIATGHYRNGILLAPVTAKLIADWITRGSVEPKLAARIGLEKFSPLRFAGAKAQSGVPKSAAAL
jgi:glycine oxidase